MKREPGLEVTAFEEQLARELAVTAALAEADVAASLDAALNGGELPATDATGIEQAWRSAERHGRGEWRVASIERIGDRWEATATHRHGQAIVVSGDAPALALHRLARTLRSPT